MIVVHHLHNSRRQRVVGLLEELGRDCEIKRCERDRITMLEPASLRAIHPLGKPPVITDGELTLAESGTMIECLVEHYGQGKISPPARTSVYLRYRCWMHHTEGSLIPPLLLKLVFGKIETAPMPFFVKPVVKAISARSKAASSRRRSPRN